MKKWRKLIDNKGFIIIICILLLVVSVNCVMLKVENDKMKEQIIKQVENQWYRLYWMADYLDKYYINNNFENGDHYSIYVNQECYRFGVGPNFWDMYDWLTGAYDSLYRNLCKDEKVLNKKEAEEIFINMNNELLELTSEIVKSEDKGWLIDEKSSKYIELNSRIEKLRNKYIEIVDNYYRNNRGIIK